MLGWKLRESKPDIWCRIHSLPESKRYPESKNEEKILLSRHNEIAQATLGSTTKLFLYWHWIESFHGIEGTKTSEYREEDFESTLYSSKAQPWQAGIFDEVILAVANDELSQIIFLNPENGSIYAPYDGGADIFVINQDHCKALKSQYSKWVSELESGL